MAHPKNTTAPPHTQPANSRPSDLLSRFRAAQGAYGIARLLQEDQAQLGELLLARDREGLLSALEFCTQALYAHHEYAYQDALPPVTEGEG